MTDNIGYGAKASAPEEAQMAGGSPMTDDLIASLRKHCDEWESSGSAIELCNDEIALISGIRSIVDELERLRAELSAGSFYKESDIDRITGALHEIADAPCICTDAHISRGLIAPNCPADDWGSVARAALGMETACRGVLSRRAREDPTATDAPKASGRK